MEDPPSPPLTLPPYRRAHPHTQSLGKCTSKRCAQKSLADLNNGDLGTRQFDKKQPKSMSGYNLHQKDKGKVTGTIIRRVAKTLNHRVAKTHPTHLQIILQHLLQTYQKVSRGLHPQIAINIVARQLLFSNIILNIVNKSSLDTQGCPQAPIGLKKMCRGWGPPQNDSRIDQTSIQKHIEH